MTYYRIVDSETIETAYDVPAPPGTEGEWIARRAKMHAYSEPQWRLCPKNGKDYNSTKWYDTLEAAVVEEHQQIQEAADRRKADITKLAEDFK